MESSIVFMVLGLFIGSRGMPAALEDGEKVPFSLEETLTPFDENSGIDWFSDTEICYMDKSSGHIMSYNVDTNSSSILLDASVLKRWNAVSYSFSPDRTRVLIGYQKDKQYCHHSKHWFSGYRFIVYDPEEDRFVHIANGSYLQEVFWIGDERSVIFNKDGDIYYVKEVMESSDVYPISRSRSPGVVFNGITDSNRKDELIGKGDLLSVSPDGTRIAYLRSDYSRVPKMTFMMYGKPGSMADQYPTPVSVRYPKAGATDSIHTALLFDLKDKETSVLAKTEVGMEKILSVDWSSDGEVVLLSMNRVQNVSETKLCRVDNISCKTIHRDENEKGWADNLLWVAGDRIFLRNRQMVGSKEYYQLSMISEGGKKRVSLTNATFTVNDFLALDRTKGIVYFRASLPDKPSTNHVFAVDEEGSTKERCITCDMVSPEGTPCKTAHVLFSPDFRYLIAECYGPAPPFVAVYKNVSPLPKPVRIVEDNAALRNLLTKRLLPDIKNLKVKVTDTMEAEVRLFLPPNAETSGEKYPLMIYVYGGPGMDQVDDRFIYDWTLYLTTNRSIICGIIDGRGISGKGTEMLYTVYRALGTVEMEDQITVTKYLRDNLDFIDRDRIGIWGWSYGGYATAKVLQNDWEGIFRCGVSVAPVSDWIYYYSGYTERYMGLPWENEKGYRESSTLHNVTNLRNKKYLLIHGTGDDNVHYQHAMQLASVLQENGIIFQQQAYPDENHYIPRFRIHLYKGMLTFWEECFRLPHSHAEE